MKVLHGINPHKCADCGDTFSRIRDLKIHIEIVHLNMTKMKKYMKSEDFINE